MSRTSLFLIAGNSATGKSTLVKTLLKKSNLELARCITTTTRPMRRGEVQDSSYHFISNERFQSLIKKQAFVEYATVFGHCYGTQKVDLEKLLKAKKNVLLILDKVGIKSVLEIYPEAMLIMLTAKRETIKNRLIKRGTDPKEIRDRLSHLKEEKELLPLADLVIATDQTTPRQVAGQVDAFIHHIVT